MTAGFYGVVGALTQSSRYTLKADVPTPRVWEALPVFDSGALAGRAAQRVPSHGPLVQVK